jgi:hypothetical protein
VSLNREARGPITLSSMNYSSQYVIPELPPAELLAELDSAARVLDALTARAAELTFEMDEQTRGRRIDLYESGETRRLAPVQLLDLLAGRY